MSLILKHTMTGALWWRCETFAQPWELPRGMSDLAQELERWYQAHELMPAYDDIGQVLARKIGAATGHEVVYLA